MFTVLNIRLRRLCSRLRWPLRRRGASKPRVVINKLGKSDSRARSKHDHGTSNGSVAADPGPDRRIRVASFNAALFSMAPAVPSKSEKSTSFDFDSEKARQSMEANLRAKSTNDRPKSILKQSPLHPNSVNDSDNIATRQQKFARSKLRVSINLPDNEISLLRNRQLSFTEDQQNEGPSNSSSLSGAAAIGRILRGKAPPRTSSRNGSGGGVDGFGYRSTRTILEVLRELDPDIVALQDVKAEEEKDMKPLSDLAGALGMNYVFAESWAPEYGNAVLSKWPIKRWKSHKIFDDTDFRNVLKATIEVPQVGEINFHCTHLDHLDENWRMKQINSIINSTQAPHILAGGLNSLEESDYSVERWSDIVKYYEEMGKPTPKVEVMRFLKSKQYTDAKDFAGECEPVVVIAKGQSVQGTCKYGTRVDYILASPESPFQFVPGSYSVLSSKGTSDHHIVKVDLIRRIGGGTPNGNAVTMKKKRQQRKSKVVKITNSTHSNGIWKTVNSNTDHHHTQIHR